MHLIISDKDARTDTYHNWFYEKLRDSNHLLVVAGDSWTWGDSLGESTPGNDNFEHRTTHSYGYLMAENLGCDYLCISSPGSSNSKIYDKIQYALDIAYSKYEKIDVIFTFTEIGREMVHDPLWVSKEMEDAKTLHQFLNIYEHNMLSSFDTYLVKKYPQVNFLFARNFTYTDLENIHLVKHTQHTWIDILNQHVDDNTYPQNLRFLSQMSTVPIIQTLKKFKLHDKFKIELMEELYNLSLAITWLEFCDLTCNRATRHPLEQGHSLWANYLLDNLYE